MDGEEKWLDEDPKSRDNALKGTETCDFFTFNFSSQFSIFFLFFFLNLFVGYFEPKAKIILDVM